MGVEALAVPVAPDHHAQLAAHLKDGGYKSRKLWFGVGTSMAIVFVSVFAAWKLPLLLPSLEVVIGGLLAVFAILCGANVGGKFAIGGAVAKNTAAKAEQISS